MFVLQKLGPPTEIFPDVLGFIFEKGDQGVYIPWVEAVEPRSGAVGRFIDHLKVTYPVVKFPTVVSPILEGMLKRRGFEPGQEFSFEFGENVELLTWRRSS